MEGPIDTGDIPESRGPVSRVPRDAQGGLPQPLPHLRDSPIRRAIRAELGRRQMTRYQLWKAARAHCPTVTQSAVYEFLRGQRDISLKYAEALLKATGLGVAPLAQASVADAVQDSRSALELLENPPAPNAKLRKAARALPERT
jgi:hypothetical protein